MSPVRAESIMLDTNVIDLLLDDPAFLEATIAAARGGRLRLVATHVQGDELAAAPGAAALLGILARVDPADVPTAGFVLDLSRLDHGSLFSDEGAARHTSFVGDSPKRAKDALILATAELEGLPLVTAESKPEKLRRAHRYFPAVHLLTVEDFRKRVGL